MANESFRYQAKDRNGAATSGVIEASDRSGALDQLAARGLFPFVLLFLFSAFTRPVRKSILDRFYGKLHTPVQPTPELEEQALEEAAQHPEKFESDKIIPGSSWEILKPGWIDVLGFGGSWVLVGVGILLLYILANLGA